jgi:DsbC/DsbD-like thiol-disulfide interchange protein
MRFRSCRFPLRYGIVKSPVFRVASPLLLVLSACGGAPTPLPVEPSHGLGEVGGAREETAGSSAAAARQSVPESVVQATFEPLVTAVRPGRPFLLAAHFRIASGYRISGKEAGEVGNPTVVSFSAPEGFEVGEAAFPIPERYTVTGGYVGLGYRDETAVFVEVTPPKKLASGAVHRFDLSASWVACKRECANEHTEAFLELVTGYGDVAAKETEAELAPFKARLPTPLAEDRELQKKAVAGNHGASGKRRK